MLATYYTDFRLLHISCVMLSGMLFTSRGLLRMKNSPHANHRALRLASYVIDTTLLLAAVVLMQIIHQYPFVDAWLTAKVLLLVLYIVLGLLTLKWSRTSYTRGVAFAGALVTFGAIVAVALAHHLRTG
jgi:uncharacterized membrane protein SirB2